MIEYKTGTILDENAEALVNTVNCVGVMGRGIALEFKKAFKDNFEAYAIACERREVMPGKMFVFETGTGHNPRYIINFPTKRHWRGKSRIKDIEAGLVSLGEQIRKHDLRSIAIPALGCGLGGLKWEEVRPLIEQAVQDFRDVQISIFVPNESTREEVSRSVPRMTSAIAALVSLMHSYRKGLLDPEVTLLELHKLMYFMQCAGEKLELKYVKAPYGPYAENLRQMIIGIDGYFINGYADGGDMPGRELTLASGAIEKAQAFLEHKKHTRDRCNRVKELVEGFETPFGLELLATVHWIAVNEQDNSKNEILKKFYNWNRHKYQFNRHQIMMAIEVLQEKEWIGSYSAEEYFDRGLARQDQDDLSGAMAYYDKAIELKPDLAQAWYNRGNIKRKQDNLPGAVADYDKAVKLDPYLAEAWLGRGNAKDYQEGVQGAMTDYDDAIKLKPDDTEVWNNRGNAKRVQGDLLGAILDYDKAIKLKPDDAEAWNNRGNAKRTQGDLSSAIIDYDEAIKLKPDDAEAWNNRGNAKRTQGDLPGAVADYDKAIKLEPDYAGAWYNRGNAKRVQGDLLGAILDYDKAITLEPDYAETWCNRGIVKLEQGDLQGAMADLNKARNLKPDLMVAGIYLSFVRDAVEVKVKPEKIRDIFVKACIAIDKLLEALREKGKGQFKSPMHYTSLDTLLNLAKREKFRLYNAKGMDDSEEGNSLFDLFDEEHRDKIRDTFSATSSEDFEVFIGNFVTTSNIDYGDDLMWRTYGKHNGEERSGCALVFDRDQHFSSQPLPLINSLEARSRCFTGKEQDAIVANKECYLYPVCYEPTKIQYEAVNNLCEVLVQLCDKKYEETCKIVAVLLNHVRYLFKHGIYQCEKEYRLTILRAGESPAVKKDLFRTYVECSLDMKEVKVLLGPEEKKAETWEQWLNDKGSFKEIKSINKSS